MGFHRFNRVLGFVHPLSLRSFAKWLVLMFLSSQLMSRISMNPEDVGRVFGAHFMPVLLAVLLAYFEAAYRKGPSLVALLPLSAKEEVRAMMGMIWKAFLSVLFFLYATIFTVGVFIGKTAVMLEAVRTVPSSLSGEEGVLYSMVFFLAFHVLLVFLFFPLAFLKRKREWWGYLVGSFLLLTLPHLYLVNQLPALEGKGLVWAGDLFTDFHTLPQSMLLLGLYLMVVVLVAFGSLRLAFLLQKPKAIR